MDTCVCVCACVRACARVHVRERESRNCLFPCVGSECCFVFRA